MDVRLPSKALRKTGLEVLGDQPWGTHYCLFFETKNDLLDILVPYFTTGLANNEFCFWVLADPLSEDEARYALRQAMRASDRHLIDRQMEFMSDAECYLSGGTFSLDRVSSEWGDRLSRSLSAGYEGIRVTGSTGWLHTREWTDFWKYEAALNESISDQPMTVLCTYSLLGSGGVDVLDVTSTHQSAVAKRGGKWEVIETAALKAAKEEVRRLNEELEQRVIERTQELAVAQAQLARVERVTTMGQLVGSITHEIAQPLSAMVINCNSCLRWLESTRPDLREARDAARAVVRDGDRINEVFRSIRHLMQKAEPRVAQLDITGVVAEVLVLARGELQQHDIEVRSEQEDNPPPVLGDRVQLQQVLLNLIVNAIQAMARVEDRPRVLAIRCSPQSAEDGVLIVVQDTGTGFDAGNTERMFETMFTTKADGMGLGLAISRSIVAAHGGRIWASPAAPFGATFHIALPSKLIAEEEHAYGSAS
jgi:signal transduction histidine kinase